MRKRSGDFIAAHAHARLTTGEVIRMLRELKGWTQQKLARRSGIHASNISLLENGRVEIGKKRAEQLAKAFDVHPAIIMFPEYESKSIGSAA
jgi:transcriptional regulator with XRE-family HTH domain